MESVSGPEPTLFTALTAPPSLFPIPEGLQCGVCLGLAVNPVEAHNCRHLFCRDCLTASVKRKKECPVCCKPLTATQILESAAARRKMEALHVRCGYYVDGCTWTGKYRDFARHQQHCEVAEVTCPFSARGCTVVTTRNALSDHMHECSVTARCAEECATLTRELQVLRRESEHRFVWAIDNVEALRDASRGMLCSRAFMAHSVEWCLKVHPGTSLGVFLVPVSHSNRALFTLTLFNANEERNRICDIDDWPVSSTEGWGVSAFIRAEYLRSSSFVVDGGVTVGAVIHGLMDG
mmetsp:Transcript_753/g.2615  ORF Transcript_753/g.2615 Transcript_753/m.2615 type:complete len:293 (-) Transcript_753:138-1016(-)